MVGCGIDVEDVYVVGVVVGVEELVVGGIDGEMVWVFDVVMCMGDEGEFVGGLIDCEKGDVFVVGVIGGVEEFVGGMDGDFGVLVVVCEVGECIYDFDFVECVGG